VWYRLRDLPAIAANPLGPYVAWGGALRLVWPVLRPAAFLYRRTVLRKTRVVAVTGSFGKTTTFRAIAAALDSATAKGSNHKSGIALRLFRTAPSERHSVLEVGIGRPGEMRGFASMVRPDIAVLCGIGSEHSRSLQTLDRTLEEKAELLAALRPDGLAILNADDARAASAANRTRGRVVTCGFSADADVRVESYGVDWPRGHSLDVLVHSRRVRVQTQLVGRQMVFPVLAALAAAHEEGVDLELAAARLATLQPAHGRMHLTVLESGAVVLNDAYKGAFESYVAAVEAAAELPAKRRLLIVGDIAEPPGTESDAYGKLGESFARVPDAWILHIGRKKQKLQAGAKRAGFPADRIVGLGKEVLPAIEHVRRLVEPGDLVLLKGRDWQKLERILMALQGVNVRCGIEFCNKLGEGCSDCPLLERGWEGLDEFMDTRKDAVGRR
jgi:UDP-N-acetylmuramoyl-tripeptide--D-alanyl-D-alanine ligase